MACQSLRRKRGGNRGKDSSLSPIRLQNRLGMYGAVIHIMLYKVYALQTMEIEVLGKHVLLVILFPCCLESAGSDLSVLCWQGNKSISYSHNCNCIDKLPLDGGHEAEHFSICRTNSWQAEMSFLGSSCLLLTQRLCKLHNLHLVHR